jgi:hypothetical protein
VSQVKVGGEPGIGHLLDYAASLLKVAPFSFSEDPQIDPHPAVSPGWDSRLRALGTDSAPIEDQPQQN